MDMDDLAAFPSGTFPTLSTRAAAAKRRRLDREFQQAVATGQLEVAYQPRIDLGTGRMIAYEALIRWPDRRRGLMLPDVILPLAERTRLSETVGAWVLDCACNAAARWSGPSVCVNVSGRQVRSAIILAQVSAALATSGLAPERLELEMTEDTLLAGGVDTLITLSALRDLGVGLLLDDFGTGLGNLVALRRLPLTAIAIDRSLVRDLPDQQETAAITHAVIQTARAMDLMTVAEGIETESQRAVLAGLGCDAGQGFLFGQPALAVSDKGRSAARPGLRCRPNGATTMEWTR